METQLGELKIIMNALVELETRHLKAAQQCAAPLPVLPHPALTANSPGGRYQEEIRLLKTELEKRGGVTENGVHPLMTLTM